MARRMLQWVGILILAFVIAVLIWLELFFLRLDIAAPRPQLWTNTLPNVAKNFVWDGQRPLNIVFLSWGSRGDHQPNVALGLELARRGHNVTVLGLHKYRDLIERHHPLLRYAPLQDDNLWALADQMGSSEGSDFFELLTGYVINSSRQVVTQYLEASKDADVLFGQIGAPIVLQHMTVAEVLQKPLFFLTHDVTLPTAAHSFSPQDSRVRNDGKRRNVFNHRIFFLIIGYAVTFGNTEWRKLRTELGLSTPWPFMQVFSPQTLADFPVFSTADPTLWIPPDDYPPHWYSTGYFETRDDQLPEKTPETVELEVWISQRKSLNRPLLFFGQGSFSHHDSSVYTDILVNTCETLEMDVVALESTVDNAEGRSLPNFVKVVPEVVLEHLFPQCAVVIHHGGAGTASQCIRAGNPGLCIPSMPFQEVWCGELEDYGAGVLLRSKEMLAAWKENGTNLMKRAVERANTATVKEAALQLSKRTRDASGGVELAADKVMEHLEALRRMHVLTATSNKATSPQQEEDSGEL